MSLETGTTLAQLVDTNPTAGDPVSQGDDHIRLIKSTLKLQFPGVGGAGFNIPITATEAELNYVHGVTSAIQTQIDASVGRVPIGIIMLWSGSQASIPAGWHICDGTNGTPDLRDVFIIGAGGTRAVHSVGGSPDSIVVSHNHSAVSTANATLLSTNFVNASHTHTFTTGNNSVNHTHSETSVGGGSSIQGGVGLALSTVQTGANSVPHTHSGTTDAGSASHNHDIIGNIPVTTTNTATGVLGTNANLPPFHALCYIMRIT